MYTREKREQRVSFGIMLLRSRRLLGVIPLQMPALSPTMTQGNVGKWNKLVGEHIAPGDALVAIETDKAVVDFESQDEGYLAKVVVNEGASDVKIGTMLGFMVDEKEEVAQIEQLIKGLNLDLVKEEAKPATTTHASTAAAANQAEVQSHDLHAGKDVTITPAALFHIKSNQLDPKSIQPSGPGNRILKSDVLNALKSGKALKVKQVDSEKPDASTSAKQDEQATSFGRFTRSFTDIPFSNMRKVIAARLTDSKKNIPHAYATAECVIDHVLKMRKDFKGKLSFNTSVNDFVIKAAALALKEVPEANAFYNVKTGEVESSKTVDISVAVATDGGLITPIVTNADSRGISSISSTVKDLATRAREGKLKPQEFQGGTFTYVSFCFCFIYLYFDV
jgi:pyruvate dehydrogenase E2 component (dihydrolipoamide acetyltransferase)